MACFYIPRHRHTNICIIRNENLFSKSTGENNFQGKTDKALKVKDQ